jgi:hypothetical protein
MLIKFDAGMPSLPLGTFGGGFGWGKNIFRVYSNNKNLSFPFCSHLGVGWGGCEWVHLDDLVLFGKTLLDFVQAALWASLCSNLLLGLSGSVFHSQNNVY